MKKIRYILLVWTLLLAHWSMAEVIILQSGKSISGEIQLQNEEVVIIRDAEGRRFQFPRSEIQEIILSTEEQIIPDQDKKDDEVKGKCALRLDLSAGCSLASPMGTGGFGSVAIQFGSRQIGSKRIFLGGSIGYQVDQVAQLYHFLPITVVTSIPLLDGKHAPELGAAIGYGIALKNPSKGGIIAKLNANWRYQFQPSSAFLLGLQVQVQQAQVNTTETIDGKNYTSCLGKSFVSMGLHMAFQF